MRGLVQRVRKSDPDAAEAFQVITRFDGLVAQRASMEELAQVAHDMTQASVQIVDLLHGRRFIFPASTAISQEVPAFDIVQTLLTSDLPPFGAVTRQEFLVAPIQTAAGLVGLVWFRPGVSPREWSETDKVVVERLASSAAINILTESQVSEGISILSPESLTTIISRDVKEGDRRSALARAGLAVPTHLSAMVMLDVGGPVGLQTTVEILAQNMKERGIVFRAGLLGKKAIIVAALPPDGEHDLQNIASAARFPGSLAVLGVGESVDPCDLWRSWEEANLAATLSCWPVQGIQIAHFSDLGSLSVLSALPADRLSDNADVRQLQQLKRQSPNDITLLEHYCETGSMRSVAQRIHLHHSSVDYRLKKISGQLGIDLNQGQGRLRVLLALKLMRLSGNDDAFRQMSEN